MAEKSGAARTRTPAKAVGTAATTPSLSSSKKPSSASTTGKQQKSILGFFTKSSKDKDKDVATTTPSSQISSSPCLKETTRANSLQLNKKPSKESKNRTPVPSSDALEPSSSQENIGSAATVKVPPNNYSSLPLPVTIAEVMIKQAISSKVTVMGSSPTRKVSRRAFLQWSSHCLLSRIIQSQLRFITAW